MTSQPLPTGPELVVSGGAPGPIQFRVVSSTAQDEYPPWPLDYDTRNGVVSGEADTEGQWLVHSEAYDANNAVVQMPPVSLQIIPPLQVQLSIPATAQESLSAAAAAAKSRFLARLANGTMGLPYQTTMPQTTISIHPGRFYHPKDIKYTLVQVPDEDLRSGETVEDFRPIAALQVGEGNVPSIALTIVPDSIVQLGSCEDALEDNANGAAEECFFDDYRVTFRLNSTEGFQSKGRLTFAIAADYPETQTPTAHVVNEQGDVLVFTVLVDGCNADSCAPGVCRYA